MHIKYYIKTVSFFPLELSVVCTNQRYIKFGKNTKFDEEFE